MAEAPGAEGASRPGRLDGAVRLGAALDRVVHGLRPDAGAAAMRSLFQVWDDAVGSVVAEHAKPLVLRDGVLTVAVDDPAWATQLTFLAPAIIERLSAEMGAGSVREVQVSVRGAARRERGSRRR